MALFFDHGAVTWNAADVATTTYTISGLTFAPKAIMLLCMGLASTVDAVSGANDAILNIGFGTSPSNRGCVGIWSDDGAGSADCTSGRSATSVVVEFATGGIVGILDLNAMNADGFQLIVDDQSTVDLRVFWFAWGGDDIVNAQVGFLQPPLATGNVSYDVTNWLSSIQGNNVVIFGISQTTATSDPIDAAIGFAAASGIGAGNQFINYSNEDDNSASADTDGYMRGDECFASITLGGGNPIARASFNGFDATGFDLNWAEVTGVGGTGGVVYLAIQGGSWKVGNYSLALGTVNNTATVSGLNFRPKGAIHASTDRVQSTADTSTAEAKQVIGCWSTLSSRRAMAYWSENGPTAMEIDLAIEYDGCLCFPQATVAAVDWVVDINAINSDGFQVIVDDARAVALTDFQSFIAFGDSPGPLAFYPDRVARDQQVQVTGMHPGRMN